MNDDFSNLLNKMLSMDGMKDLMKQYENKEVTGEAGAGAVKISIDFAGNLKNVYISEEYVADNKTRELLCQMIMIAFNNARAKLMSSFGSDNIGA
ncbi:YbaB/EbfC family nucleoid-associated protein [Anaplasmataceae bacterium AB001_6]|nr:YbaB/EbfC family nucleoid-associated protein [Anaplasmataceae bacterium AB001_6]